ncbi:MAG TPA: DnaJ domain-containing protein [Solirubrobacteraceae bacterium]|jgi:multidrug efflux pump subunit AcrA (membrane-fusion protein)
MAAQSRDPYEVLGVPRNASDAELRAAYRRLVQRHHPDHNNGSVESARRFEEVQEAYAQVVKLRAAQGPSPTAEAQSDVDARIADLERQVREARVARERAERAAAEARRQAARAASADLREQAGRPSDEDLGYVTTDDSFTKVLDDAWADFRRWLGDVRKSDKQ